MNQKIEIPKLSLYSEQVPCLGHLSNILSAGLLGKGFVLHQEQIGNASVMEKLATEFEVLDS